MIWSKDLKFAFTTTKNPWWDCFSEQQGNQLGRQMHLSGPVCPICCCFFWPTTSFVLYFPQFFLGQTVHHRVTPNFQVIVFLRITLLVHKYHFLPVKLVGIFQSLNKWNEGNEFLWQADSDKVPKDTIQNCFLLICLLCLVTTLLLPLMPVWAWIKPGDVALPPWKQTEKKWWLKTFAQKLFIKRNIVVSPDSYSTSFAIVTQDGDGSIDENVHLCKNHHVSSSPTSLPGYLLLAFGVTNYIWCLLSNARV